MKWLISSVKLVCELARALRSFSDPYCQLRSWLTCITASNDIVSLLISCRQCGLAYCTLHAAKQGWQLLTSWKVPDFGRSVFAPYASPRALSRMNWFLPARRYASAGNSDRNVSVCLSVTSRYCIKTKKVSIMISSPSGSPKTLVFQRQISSLNCKGFPRTGASKKSGVWKFSDFLALSVNISKTIADTAKVTISD